MHFEVVSTRQHGVQRGKTKCVFNIPAKIVSPDDATGGLGLSQSSTKWMTAKLINHFLSISGFNQAEQKENGTVNQGSISTTKGGKVGFIFRLTVYNRKCVHVN